jgi:hypothetical protein
MFDLISDTPFYNKTFFFIFRVKFYGDLLTKIVANSGNHNVSQCRSNETQ